MWKQVIELIQNIAAALSIFILLIVLYLLMAAIR